jgi:hypothetical protein
VASTFGGGDYRGGGSLIPTNKGHMILMFDILIVEHLKSYENCMSFGCKSIGKPFKFPIDLHQNEAKND